MDFKKESEKFFKQLGASKLMVLATSENDRVTARMMSCIIIDGNIYFQTDKKFDKYTQMTANLNVALCIDNIQIEGTASFLGHLLNDENKVFAAAYKRHHKGSFNTYSSLPDNVLVKVVPAKITLWKYRLNQVYRLFFDMVNEEVEKEIYL
jgi:general stress protein 26